MVRFIGISVVLALLSGQLFSQNVEKGLFVYGQITEIDLSDSTESAVRQLPIRVVCDSVIIEDITCTNGGKYQFKVPFGYKYEIQYGGEEYLMKTLLIDATDPSIKTMRRGYRLELDISLFKSENPEAAKILAMPVAKGSFSRKSNAIDFDEEYNEEAALKLKKALAKKSK